MPTMAQRYGEDDPIPEFRCDVFMLCDAATAVDGKLFVLGGGWDRIWVPTVPIVHPMIQIAIRLLVPWAETNEDIKLVVGVEDEDGSKYSPWPLAEMDFQMGRPPGVPRGTDLPFAAALTIRNLELRNYGTYTFVMYTGDRCIARTAFHVTQLRQ